MRLFMLLTITILITGCKVSTPEQALTAFNSGKAINCTNGWGSRKTVHSTSYTYCPTIKSYHNPSTDTTFTLDECYVPLTKER